MAAELERLNINGYFPMFSVEYSTTSRMQRISRLDYYFLASQSQGQGDNGCDCGRGRVAHDVVEEPLCACLALSN